MEIRFAQAKDTPQILKLLRQVGRVHHLGRPDLFRSDACKYGASQILGMLDNPRTPIFVAVEEENVLGYGFCQIKTYSQDPVIKDHTSLYIDDLCVEENCRGQKVGTALYEEICRYAKMRKCYSITLNVWQCNQSAMEFYGKMGLMPQKTTLETVLEQENAE